jgi:tetratricopeptide (TPR) repeat protein
MLEASPSSKISERVQIHRVRPTGKSARFVNHKDSCEMITNFLADKEISVVTILGRGGIGKSRLSAYVFSMMKEAAEQDPSYPLTHIICIDQSEADVDWMSAALYEIVNPEIQLLLDEVKKSYKDTRIQIRQMLNALHGQGRYIFFIDNAQRLLTQSGSFANRSLEDFFEGCFETDSEVFLLLASQSVFNLSKPGYTRIVDIENENTLAVEHGVQILLQHLDRGRVDVIDKEQMRRAVDRVGVIPRAIEIVAEIINKDEDPFATLDALFEDADDLNKILESLIHENYDRCSEDAKQVMRAMSVYKRAVPIKALKRMLNREDSKNIINVDAAVKELTNRTTIQQYQDDRTRERLVTLKRVDQEWLYKELMLKESNLLGDWEERAADYYVSQHPKRKGKINSLADLEPIQFAISHFIDAKQYQKAFDTLFGVDAPHFLRLGHYEIVYQFYKQLEGKIKGDDAIMVQIMLGQTSYCLGRLKDAAQYYKEALKRTKKKSGFMQEEAATHNGLGITSGEVGRFDEALEHFEKALPLAQKLKNRAYEGNLYANIGQELMRLGRFDEAEQKIDLGLQMIRRGEDKATALGNQAYLMLLKGDLSGALEIADRAFSMVSKDTQEDRGIQSHCGYYLALAQLLNNKVNAAHKTLIQIEKLPEPANTHNIRALLGLVEVRRGEIKAAKEYFKKTIQTFKEARKSQPNEKPLFDMLFASALAQAGLLLCDPNPTKPADVKYYQQALESVTVNKTEKAKGVVKTALLLVDELAQSDPKDLLSSIHDLLQGAL